MNLGRVEEYQRLAELETDDCVIWPHGKAGPMQYGQIFIKRHAFYVHRLALARRVPQPDGKPFALHGPCNTPTCLNYRHLYWGDHQQNMADMIRDGTRPRGERIGTSVLTEARVIEIRRLAADGVRQRAIATAHGLSFQHVNAVVNRKAWRHVA